MSTSNDSAVVDRGDDFTSPNDKPEPKEPADLPKDKEAALRELDPETKDGETKDGDPETKDGEIKDDDKKPRKDSRIPAARHKELLDAERAKRTALEQRLAQYERGQEVAKSNEDITKAETDLTALDKQYHKVLADGEVEKAAELMGKIRQLERDITEMKGEMRTAAAVAQATEMARYNTTLERVEESYPELNQDADDTHAEHAQDVADLMRVYRGRGLPPYKALQDAVKKVMGDPKTKAQETAVETKARVSAEEVAAERKKAAVAKTADAVGRQPPSTSKAGMDSDKTGGKLSATEVMKMDQDAFAKLDEAELRRLRGDDL